MGSVDVNPPNASIHISNHGTNWLWSVFALMAVSMLGMLAWTFMVRTLHCFTDTHAH